MYAVKYNSVIKNKLSLELMKALNARGGVYVMRMETGGDYTYFDTLFDTVVTKNKDKPWDSKKWSEYLREDTRKMTEPGYNVFKPRWQVLDAYFDEAYQVHQEKRRKERKSSTTEVSCEATLCGILSINLCHPRSYNI